MVGAGAPSPSTADASTTFDPPAGAAVWWRSVFTDVVADGRGWFHAVTREDGLAQAIVYRRSNDGGRTWHVSGRFAGESGGATRPQLAVWGSTVAVSFIGGFCLPAAPSVCGEAPYVAVSSDGGANFTAPHRLADNAFQVKVAVSDDVVWTTWWGRDARNNDVVEVRALRPGNLTPLSTMTRPGLGGAIAVASGAGAVVYGGYVSTPPAGGTTPVVQFVRNGQLFGTPVALPARPVQVVAGGGLVHLLFRRTNGVYEVVTASLTGANPVVGSPVSVGAASNAAITASRRLVAVALFDAATGVTSIVRSSDGTAFSAPTPVARSRPTWSNLAIRATTVDERSPVARVAWRQSTAPGSYVVDACASVPGRGSLTLRYEWFVDGTAAFENVASCSVTLEVPDGSTRRVGVRVFDDAGNSAQRTVVVPVTPTVSDPALEQSTIGDLHVAVSNDAEVVTAAALDTGTGVTPLAYRRVDRLVSGDGGVGIGVAPAADQGASVATWVQWVGPGLREYRSIVAQLGVDQNVAVTRVRLSQGPVDAARWVADRPARVLATIDATVAGVAPIDVRFVVVDDQGNQVLNESRTVQLGSGPASLLSQSFPLIADRTYTSTVVVTDPPTASAPDPGDNSLTSKDLALVEAGRPIEIAYLPINVGSSTVDCRRAGQFIERSAARARAMLPVVDLRTRPACAVTLAQALPQKEAAVDRLIDELDYLARIAGVDAVVGVFPPGWLDAAHPNSSPLGIAKTPGRGVVLDISASDVALAHELTHNQGIDHSEPALIVEGVWVAQNQRRSGADYMSIYDLPQGWVAPVTWDDYLHRLGGPSKAPQPPVAGMGAEALWIRGRIVPDTAGGTTVIPSPWVPVAPSSATSTSSPTGDTPTVEAVQLDASGAPVDSQPLTVGTTGGVFLPGTTPGEPIGQSFEGLVQLKPETERIQIVFDGTVVESRPVNDAPTVRLTAPTAGVTTSRGAALEVAWEATDPDGDPLRTDLLVSGDGGDSWQPLALDVGESPVTVTVPAQLDGDRVRVRVVVNDGVRLALATSEAFTVGAAASEVRERIAFVRHGDRFNTYLPVPAIYTMEPDGSDVQAFPLGPTRAYPCFEGRCEEAYPAWSADGSRLFFSSTMRHDPTDRVRSHLWSARPDGSDLRQITTAIPTGADSTFHEINVCADQGTPGGRIAWLGYNHDNPAAEGVWGPMGASSPVALSGGRSLWSANEDGAEPRRIFAPLWGEADPSRWPERPLGTGWGWNPAATQMTLLLPSPSPARLTWTELSACPQVSPDGTRVAFITQIEEFPRSTVAGYALDSWAVVVMGIDGSNPRIVTDKFHWYQSVDWLDNATLVALRIIYPTCFPRCTTWPFTESRYQPVRIDLSTLATAPLTAASYHGLSGPTVTKVGPERELYGTAAFTPSGLPESRPLEEDTRLWVIEPYPTYSRIVNFGSPATRDVLFDWARVVTSSGPSVPHVGPEPPLPLPAIDAGGPYRATVDRPVTLSVGGTALDRSNPGTISWDLDADGEFDDAVGAGPVVSFPNVGVFEIRVRVTPSDGPPLTSEVTTVVVDPDRREPIAADPDVYAEGPVIGPSRPIDLDIELDAGETADVSLGRADPASASLVVDYDSTVLQIDSGDGADPAVPGISTGADGTVRVTAARGFSGRTSFTYARVSEPSVTATVRVLVHAGDSPGDPPPDGGGGPGGTPVNGPAFRRVAGADRYATAAAVSFRTFDPGVAEVFVVTGEEFADGVTAGAIAGRLRAPVLLVRSSQIPASTAAELRRLEPGEIVLVGGPARIDASVEAALSEFTDGAVRRIAGSDRYGTAAALSEAFVPAGVDEVYVATGADFADALAVAAAAGARRVPVLLVRPTALPPETARELERLRPDRITVVGGAAAVADSVVDALRQHSTVEVRRVAGRDRYATAVAVSADTFDRASQVYLATGRQFADALAAGPVAAMAPGPVLLAQPTCLPRGADGEIRRLAANEVVVLGGEAALGRSVTSRVLCR
jgi:putative cell wall-binding protein